MSHSSAQNLDPEDRNGADGGDQEHVALLGGGDVNESSDVDTAKSSPSPSSKAARITFAVCFYLMISLSMVFLNKQVLSTSAELKAAPLFFTWTQVVVAVFGCWVFGILGRSVRSLSMFPEFEYKIETARTVAPVTIAFCGMLVFNNLCLKYVQLSFYQVARSLTIPFNILLSGALLSNWPSVNVMGTCGVIVTGYVCGVTGEIEYDRYGVFFGVCSSMFVAGYSIMVKRALKEVGDSMERLMIYTNVNTALMLPVVFVLSGELDTLRLEYFFTMRMWLQIIAAGCTGFLIGFATFLQIKETSPLTHNVSGTFKACVQTILAVIWFRSSVSALAATGFILVVGGSYAYSTVKRSEMAVADAQKKAKANEGLEDFSSHSRDLKEKVSPATSHTIELEQGTASSPTPLKRISS